ncbi:MAG: TIGR03016 family PEP-CTERM system-associated outer membrane protein [Rhodocyclaceae bacterium]|nr:TIGR03016 family PEP-CTERM system-associated outer membrane protein [Rhodocyclaceae bacterium]
MRCSGLGLRGVAGLGSMLAVMFLPTQAPAEGWRITPRINVRETYSDNINLGVAAAARSDWVTELSPGFSLRQTQAGRLKADVDYALTSLSYAQGAGADRTANSLRASASYEAIDRWLFLDARANVGLQGISAFSAQPTGLASVTNNQAETRSVEFAPRIEGRLRDASYQLRYSATQTSSDVANFGTAQAQSWTGRIGSAAGLSRLGWSVDFYNRQTKSEGASAQDQARVAATLSYRLVPDLSLYASLGREKSSAVSANSNNQGISSIGGTWTPNERTSLNLERRKRIFGTGYVGNFSHRQRMLAFNVSYSRDITDTAALLAVPVNPANLATLDAALSSTYPDPAIRQNVLMNLLAQSSLIDTQALTFGVLTNRVFVDKRWNATVALNGVRNTLTFTAYRSIREALSNSLIADDFTGNGTLTQMGAYSSLSHHLSPNTSANLGLRWSKSTGDGPTAQELMQRSLLLDVSTKIGPHSSGNVGVRRVRNDTGGGETRENAVTASFLYSF